MKAITGIVLAILAVASSQVVSAQGDTASDMVVVTVNGEPITAAEVNMVMARVASELGSQGKQADRQAVSQVASERAIDTKLLFQEARRLDLKLEEGKVDTVIAGIEKQVGGRETLETNLAGIGLSYERLLKNITEAELAQLLIETRIAPEVKVTDEDVQKFYTANPEMFKTAEQVRARHILMKVEQDVTDEVRQGAKARAEAARKRAVDGEDFAKLAEELSEGPSASKGGDLGFFPAGRMVKPFSDAAFALKPGEVSPVVETRFGYHVIKVEERKPAAVQTLDEVRSELRRGLESRQFGEKVTALLTSLRAKAEIVSPGPAAVPAGE